MKPSTFLTGLWGPLPAGARIALWELRGKKSHWLISAQAADYWAGQPDIYTGVAIAAKDHGRRNRCPANQAAGIAGLWLDVDVNGGPDNKTGAFDTVDQAIAAAHRVTEPTILVHSGHGLHVWWLFDAPWYFRGDRDQGAQLAARWQQAHRDAGPAFDATHDLARLLRIPGTLNAKDPADPRAVTVLPHRGPRHPRAALMSLVDGVTLPTPTVLSTSTEGVQVTLDRLPSSGLHPDHLAALLDNDPELADVFWHRARLYGPRGDQSWSAYDLALCTRMAKHMDDEQLARLIVSHRVAHNAPPKHQRLDYVQRTIRIARGHGTSRAATALDQIGLAA